MSLIPYDNIYVLSILIGLADVTGCLAYDQIMTKVVPKFRNGQVLVQSSVFFTISILAFTLLMSIRAHGSEYKSFWYGILIVIIRLNASVAFNLSYL